MNLETIGKIGGQGADESSGAGPAIERACRGTAVAEPPVSP
jgi:hypothetical protein